ncbi:hypothetical protein ONZ45_g5008 [Pleurotus djamor]|nr:hypothetical protein ONZ45_g5008 [Pleurotus djamor]
MNHPMLRLLTSLCVALTFAALSNAQSDFYWTKRQSPSGIMLNNIPAECRTTCAPAVNNANDPDCQFKTSCECTATFFQEISTCFDCIVSVPGAPPEMREQAQILLDVRSERLSHQRHHVKWANANVLFYPSCFSHGGDKHNPNLDRCNSGCEPFDFSSLFRLPYDATIPSVCAPYYS